MKIIRAIDGFLSKPFPSCHYETFGLIVMTSTPLGWLTAAGFLIILAGAFRRISRGG